MRPEWKRYVTQCSSQPKTHPEQCSGTKVGVFLKNRDKSDVFFTGTSLFLLCYYE